MAKRKVTRNKNKNSRPPTQDVAGVVDVAASFSNVTSSDGKSNEGEEDKFELGALLNAVLSCPSFPDLGAAVENLVTHEDYKNKIPEEYYDRHYEQLFQDIETKLVDNPTQLVRILKYKDLISKHYKSFKAGKFFFSFNKILNAIKDPTNFTNDTSTSFVRTDMKCSKKKLKRYYENTATAVSCSDDASSVSGRSSHDVSPVDIFGNTGGHYAHLMPNSDKCSTFWYPIVPWVLTIAASEQADYWITLQKYIHGTEKQRLACTGIKHFPSNLIKLRLQADYLDKYSSLLIIPILDASSVKQWNGSAYSAIVLATPHTDGSKSSSDIYREIGATEVQENDVNFLATLNELEIAILLLRQFVFHFAQTLTTLSNEVKNEAEAAWSKYHAQENLYSVLLGEGLVYPELNRNNLTDGQASRKVTFVAWDDNGTNTEKGHPAPDPILLLSKAASNWSKRNGIKLIPGCNDAEDEVDDDDDEVDADDDMYLNKYEEERAMGEWIRKPADAIDIKCDMDTDTDADTDLTDDEQ